MLFMVADTYRNAGQFDVAISRESNPGVGELDFQITRVQKQIQLWKLNVHVIKI